MKTVAGRERLGKQLSERVPRTGTPDCETIMKIESAVRIMAGTFVLLSLALATWVSHYWLWMTAFVGVNLLQSGFTRFCPAEIILTRLGVGKRDGSCCG